MNSAKAIGQAAKLGSMNSCNNSLNTQCHTTGTKEIPGVFHDTQKKCENITSVMCIFIFTLHKRVLRLNKVLT